MAKGIDNASPLRAEEVLLGCFHVNKLISYNAFQITTATTRRTRSTKRSRVFAFIIALRFRALFEVVLRGGTICLAPFKHFRGEHHRCLMPLPLSAHARCVACSACFGLVPLILPLERIYAFYAFRKP